MAVKDLNAAGGVLGQQVELITADDFCDPDPGGRRRKQAGQ
jgi:branched-chain amino acid transport system substrate-binding protein